MNKDPNPHHRGAPAFPVPPATEYDSPDPGMSLRDYFAASALQGILSDPNVTGKHEKLARWCYDMADAMLEARTRAPGGTA